MIFLGLSTGSFVSALGVASVFFLALVIKRMMEQKQKSFDDMPD